MRRRFRRKISKKFMGAYFKPQGIPMRNLEQIILSFEELETLRLRYIEKLTQNDAADKMGISQSQYQRDLVSALEKITSALIEKKAIKIEENKMQK